MIKLEYNKLYHVSIVGGFFLTFPSHHQFHTTLGRLIPSIVWYAKTQQWRQKKFWSGQEVIAFPVKFLILTYHSCFGTSICFLNLRSWFLSLKHFHIHERPLLILTHVITPLYLLESAVKKCLSANRSYGLQVCLAQRSFLAIHPCLHPICIDI